MDTVVHQVTAQSTGRSEADQGELRSNQARPSSSCSSRAAADHGPPRPAPEQPWRTDEQPLLKPGPAVPPTTGLNRADKRPASSESDDPCPYSNRIAATPVRPVLPPTTRRGPPACGSAPSGRPGRCDAPRHPADDIAGSCHERHPCRGPVLKRHLASRTGPRRQDSKEQG